MNNSIPGLFTDQDGRNDKETAHDAVVNYREWAAMQSVWLDWFARRVKIADIFIFFLASDIFLLDDKIGDFYK
jgi:hypothetical protein